MDDKSSASKKPSNMDFQKMVDKSFHHHQDRVYSRMKVDKQKQAQHKNDDIGEFILKGSQSKR